MDVTRSNAMFGGVDMDFPIHSTRSNFCKPAENFGAAAPIPTSANSPVTVYCKRLVNPSLQKVDKVVVVHGATSLTVGAGTPRLKFAAYRIGTNGRPTTKVAGIEGTIALRTGATYAGVGVSLATATAFPKCGSFVMAWIANTSVLTTPNAGTFYGSSDTQLGSGQDSLSLLNNWTEQHDIAVTVPDMYTNDATFNAFVFPDTFAILNPSAWANVQSTTNAGGTDWYWRYQQNANI
jgi:hypothetical protein